MVAQANLNNTEAAKVILDLRQRRFLKPCLGQERSVQQAAEELQIKPNSLLYQVKRLVRLGLLQQTRLLRWSGRPQKLYRATADSFYVPFSLYDAATLEEILMVFDLPWLEWFNRNLARAILNNPGGPDGFLIERQSDGRVRVVFAHGQTGSLHHNPANHPTILSDWLVLRLSPSEAKALQKEQLELFSRYSGYRKGQPYAVLLGLTPVSIDSELVVFSKEPKR
jgi:hypothetical protein